MLTKQQPTSRGDRSLEKEEERARFPKSAVSVTLALGLVVIGWALVALFFKETRFVFVSPEAQVGVEAASALARLFGALVVGLYAVERPAGRLPWIAAALAVLGFGSLVFGYGELLLEGVSLDADEAAYEALGIWTIAGALLVIGLVPRAAPSFTRQTAVAVALFALLFGLTVDPLSGHLPDRVLLVGDGTPLAFAANGVLPEVTAWHLSLSSVPLLLASAATVGATRAYRRGEVRGWVIAALVLFVGAQLHALYWPPGFGPVLAASDILRLAFAAAVVVGGITEVRSLARSRAKLLAGEEERRRRLEELASMKVDFTSMVAHEFASPLFATRGYADVLASEGLCDTERRRFLGRLRAETGKLEALVEDVRASTAVESEDFSLSKRPVSVTELLSEAAPFAEALPGEHPVEIRENVGGLVRADLGRIGQVLRNLLKNAAVYSPDGSRISLEASPGSAPGRVRFSVSDRGKGVRPDETERIFGKFIRGAEGDKAPGTGLGLYLSRRIIRTHGSDLRVSAAPDGGSVFHFELESVVRQQEAVRDRRTEA